MKKITLLILVVTSIAYSQIKKEYYLDENWKVISKQEFLKNIDHAKNIDYYTENDTAIFGKIIVRENFGKIDDAILIKVRQFLENESGLKTDPAKKIVINFYHGNDEEIPAPERSRGNRYDRDYLKKLNKITPVNQFWVYKDTTNLRYNHGKKLQWHHDKDLLIEKTFFPYYFKYGSFVIIDSEGNYYSFFGEYGKTTVWEGMKKFIAKYGN